MPQILVNGLERPLDPPCEYWGQALEQLDQGAERLGKVLTAVRFDGVDQPSFRDATRGGVAIADVAVVEAEWTNPLELLETSINDAEAAAMGLIAPAERLGTTFRGFDVSYANQDLVELAEGLSTLVNILRALADAAGVSIEALVGPRGNAPTLIAQLSDQVVALLDAQEAEDWITVADVIEYDIAPTLQGWPELFESLRTALPR